MKERHKLNHTLGYTTIFNFWCTHHSILFVYYSCCHVVSALLVLVMAVFLFKSISIFFQYYVKRLLLNKTSWNYKYNIRDLVLLSISAEDSYTYTLIIFMFYRKCRDKYNRDVHNIKKIVQLVKDFYIIQKRS